MSISSTVERSNQAGRGALRTLGSAVRRLCAAYIAWRLHCAIVLLRSMSDQELGDIGLPRSDIANVVRARAGRNRAFTCEY